MADIPSLNLDFPDIGGDENTWGEVLNEIMLTTAAKANDSVSIATVGGTTILSSSQELVGSIVVTGTLASAGVLEFSGRTGVWVISNETTGAYSLTARIGASGDTLEVARGKAQVFASTGTAWIGTAGAGDFVPIDGSVPMTGDLALGTHKITGLAPGYDYTDGASVLQTGGAIGRATDLIIDVTGNTTISLSATAVTLGTADLIPATQYTVSATINVSNTGANGRDAGTLPTNDWLAVYAIYNPTTGVTAGLVSLNFDYAPTLPSGYTFMARLGSVYINSDGHLWRSWQSGRHAVYRLGTLPADGTSLILGGGATGGEVPIDLTGYVPPKAVAFDASLFLPSDDSAVVGLKSSGVYYLFSFYIGLTVATIPIPSISSSITYDSDSNNADASILGWWEPL